MKTRILAPVALALVLVLPALAQDRPPVQGPPGQPPERRMTFTFRGATIQTFLGYLSREAGFTFIFESAVTGEITAIAEQPVTRDQALEILRAWLLPKQKTLHRTGDIVRIMSLEEAKRRGLPVKIGSDPAGIADTDELITQVLTLRYVKAGDVKTELSGLLSDKGSLMGEGTSNTLVITDTSASIRRFAEVLAALDKAVTAELHVRVFKLKNARADEVALIVSDLFEGSSTVGGNNQGGRGGGGRGGRGGGGGGGGGPGGGFQEAARMFFGGGGGGGGGAAATGGAQTTSVNVSSDARTNSVVVTATTDQLRLVEELVKDLDADPDEVITTLKAIPLVNADATSLAKTLETLFADDTTSTQQNQRGGNQGGGGRNFLERMQAVGQTAQASADERYAPRPKFTTDTRTNTIIVSATQSDLAMIEQLARDLDKDATEMSGVLVLPLQHAEATEIATVLQEVLQNSANSQTAGGGGNNAAANEGRAARQARQAASAGGVTQSTGNGGTTDLVGNVTVTADDGSNALVFTSSPKNFSRLRALVAELDVVRREVFIECLIAEVQLNDRGELGIQWSQAFTNSIENAEEGTQNLGTDFGLDALTDGLRYTTTSDKLTGLLRALRTEGRLNILSTPKILALENAAAEISVGQEVPYVTNSRVTQNGDTVNTIQYRDVGVILRVTPQVSDAGAVTLVVHPEVSSISPDSQSVQISEGVRSPTFNKEFADTTIIVHAGQTAVIGGLIRDTFTETFRSIPYLGDIPILGRLFGATTREKIKQEIVVFLTPHVIESPGQLARVSHEQVAQYAYVPTEVMQDELDRWLKNLEEGSHSFLYNRGTVLLESGRIDDAISTLEKARDLDPRDPATRLNLGLSFARAGLLSKAQEELTEAERLAPGDADIAWDLGCVLWRRGDVPRAARNFERVLLLDPAHQEAQRWLPKARRELERISRELTGVGVNPPTPVEPTPDGTKGQGTPPVPGPEGQKK